MKNNLKDTSGYVAGRIIGGRGGIRTHGELAPSAVFKTAALNHSTTLPTPDGFAGNGLRNQVDLLSKKDEKFPFSSRAGRSA